MLSEGGRVLCPSWGRRLDQYGQKANPCKLPKGEGAKMNEGIGQGRAPTWRRQTSLFPSISGRQAVKLIKRLLLGKAEMSQQQVNKAHICSGSSWRMCRGRKPISHKRKLHERAVTTFLLGHPSDLPTFAIRLVGISNARRKCELGASTIHRRSIARRGKRGCNNSSVGDVMHCIRESSGWDRDRCGTWVPSWCPSGCTTECASIRCVRGVRPLSKVPRVFAGALTLSRQW